MPFSRVKLFLAIYTNRVWLWQVLKNLVLGFDMCAFNGLGVAGEFYLLPGVLWVWQYELCDILFCLVCPMEINSTRVGQLDVFCYLQICDECLVPEEGSLHIVDVFQSLSDNARFPNAHHI